MDIARIIFEIIGSLLFLLECYLLMSDKMNIKIKSKLFRKLEIMNFFSCIFSILSLIIGKIKYNRFDMLLIIVITITFIPFVIFVVNLFKKKERVNIIEYKIDNNYRKLTEEERVNYNNIIKDNSAIMLKTKEGDKIALFETPIKIDRIEKNDFLELEKHCYNETEYYLAVIVKKAGTLKDYLNFVFDLYVIFVAVYGFTIISNLYLKNIQVGENDFSLGFLVLPLAYAIFSINVYFSRAKNNSFKKVWFYISIIYKIIIMIELLCIWFI